MIRQKSLMELCRSLADLRAALLAIPASLTASESDRMERAFASAVADIAATLARDNPRFNVQRFKALIAGKDHAK